MFLPEPLLPKTNRSPLTPPYFDLCMHGPSSPPRVRRVSMQLRFEGWLGAATPAATSGFSVRKNSSTAITIGTDKLALTIQRAAPRVALAVAGVEVFAETAALSWRPDPDCIPGNWTPLAKGQATTLGDPGGGCLRMTRTLGAAEDIFGFGQVPQPNLSAVGAQMLLATSAANLPDGQSHAPAPFFLSVGGGGGNASSVAHGFLLNTNRYSMWDVGVSAMRPRHTPHPHTMSGRGKGEGRAMPCVSPLYRVRTRTLYTPPSPQPLPVGVRALR